MFFQLSTHMICLHSHIACFPVMNFTQVHPVQRNPWLLVLSKVNMQHKQVKRSWLADKTSQAVDQNWQNFLFYFFFSPMMSRVFFIDILINLVLFEYFQVLHTNQFSVTKHSKVVSSGMGDAGLPGVFIMYELSPMMVKYTEKQRYLCFFLKCKIICLMLDCMTDYSLVSTEF